jgi:YesN/AraC family two-component response regulator
MVDDEADIDILTCQKFRHEIKAGQYQFYFARNGQQALEILRLNPEIAIVLTDINMPHMNGYELLLQLKKIYPHVKTIIISAYGDTESIALAQQIGAEKFINKPIDFNELKALIEELNQT